MALSSKFLRISNITKLDVFLAMLVGILTFLIMSMMSGAADQNMTLLFMILAIISVVDLMCFPSELGLYWGASNLVAISQQIVLRFVVLRETQLEPKNDVSHLRRKKGITVCKSLGLVSALK